MSDRNSRKTKVGVVVSNKMDKTITVAVEEFVRHSLYGKAVKRTKKFRAHDEENTCSIGDTSQQEQEMETCRNRRESKINCERRHHNDPDRKQAQSG